MTKTLKQLVFPWELTIRYVAYQLFDFLTVMADVTVSGIRMLCLVPTASACSA
jgi:hypothetical protein